MTGSLLRIGAAAAFLAAAVMWGGTILFFILGTSDLMSVAAYIVVPLLLLVVLAATRSVFNAKGYRSANGTIIGLMALDALGVLYALGVWAELIDTPSGPFGWLSLAPTALLFALTIPFCIQMLRFRRLAGGGIWMATALLYLLLAALMLTAWGILAIGAMGTTPGDSLSGNVLVPSLFVMLFCAIFVFPPAMICHGVALFSAAATVRA